MGTSLGLGRLPADTRFEFGVKAGDGTGWGTTATRVCTTAAADGGAVSGQADLVDPPPLNTFFYSFYSYLFQPNTSYTFTFKWWHTRTGPPPGTHTFTCTTQPAD